MHFKAGITFVFTILCFSACHKDISLHPALPEVKVQDVPIGFPKVIYPSDNGFTKPRWLLGKTLFYDKRLSKDSSVSCASCHKSDLAFSDNVAKTDGVFGRAGKRNAPTLTNVAHQPYYTREGAVKTLESQVLIPIQEHNEFGFNIIEITKRLASDSTYQRMSNTAYQRNLDYYTLVRSIATFERTIISGNSPFDQYQYQDKTAAITGFEKAGKDLFYSKKTDCSSCHSGFNFTNYAFENNGLYAAYADIGRQRLTNQPEDQGRFKVPTLRNVAVTAPYMHDGSIHNLEAVIEHYNTGGTNHMNKSGLIRPLNLTEIEKKQLVAFLNTLTDHEFLNNTILKNE